MLQYPSGPRPFTRETLQDQLAGLSDPKTVLTLHVSDGFSERIVYFVNGTVSIVSHGIRRGPDILDLLYQQGKLFEDDPPQIIEESRTTNLSIQDVLLRRQVVTQEECDEMSRKLIYREIFDLVFWDDSLFIGCSAPPAPEFFQSGRFLISARLDFNQLCDDTVDWTKKWLLYRNVLYGDSSQLTLKNYRGSKELEEDDSSKEILHACENGTTLQQLWRTMEMELPELCSRVIQLVEKGFILVTPDTRIGSSIEEMEKNLPNVINREMAWRRLVVLCRKAGMNDKACSYLQLIADETEARGDWRGAYEHLQQILSLRREDMKALRKFVNVSLNLGMKRKAIKLTLQAAESLFNKEKRKELQEAAEIMRSIPKTEFLTREIYADLSILKGNREKALGEYRSLAAQYEEMGEPERALKAASKAAACDPKNEGLKRRIANMKQRFSDLEGPAGKKPAEISKSSRALSAPNLLIYIAVTILSAIILLGMYTIFSFRKQPASAETPEAGNIPTEGVSDPDGQGGQPEEEKGDVKKGGAPENRLVLPPRNIGKREICALHGTHQLVTWKIGRWKSLRFGDSCDLTIVDCEKRGVVLKLEGKKGHRWAIGSGGDRFCSWKPGRKAIIYMDQTPVRKVETSWIIPFGTKALALGTDSIAIRQGKTTSIHRMDGALTGSRELPLWEEGVIARNFLIIACPMEKNVQWRNLWLVNASTLQMEGPLNGSP